MSCSQQKNPLSRGGADQGQRLLPGLADGYVLIDEKDYGDWIVFATKFAAYIKFFDASNAENGNWKQFFEKDIAAISGTIAIQNIAAYSQSVKERFDVVRSDDYNQTELKEAFGSLFGCALTLLHQINLYYVILERGVSLNEKFRIIIKGAMAPVLKKIIGYYKGAKTRQLIREKDYPDWVVFNAPVQKPKTILLTNFNKLWYEGFSNWEDFIDAITPETSIYGAEDLDKAEQIQHAANHNFFSVLFDQLLKGFVQLTDAASEMLSETLSAWPKHLPHYTLFLSFLKLFKEVQSDINRFTGRHLDYYYKEVLKIGKKTALPNSAHLVLTLNKPIQRYLLPSGTLFKAGKDGAGKDIFYSSDRDVLLNKGAVAELKTLYKGQNHDNLGIVKNDGRLFAAPVINSSDGLGKELTSAKKEWHPFVNKTFKDGALMAITMPRAEIGFAIASHYLFLNEGSRKVKVRFIKAKASDSFNLDIPVKCFLTTEKGWFEVVDPEWRTERTIKSSRTLEFSLTGSDPAIVAYDPKIHGGVFASSVPLLKVILINSDGQPYPYQQLKGIRIEELELSVIVGEMNGYSTDGVKQLNIAGDTGLLDPSQTFMPFGSIPETGASFIVGSKEVFSKKNAQLAINLQWKGLPGDPNSLAYTGAGDTNASTPTVSFQFLRGADWVTDGGLTAVNIFDGLTPELSIPENSVNIPDDATVSWQDDFEAYSVAASGGYMRLKLGGNFGHKNYRSGLMAEMALEEPNPASHVEPYTPAISSLSLSYTAEHSSFLADAKKEIQFYHICPFGIELQNNQSTLLPVFGHTANASFKDHEGEWYIGLTELSPGDSVDILFQVLEGSTNPLLDKPEDHVSWHYLSNNGWKQFVKEDVLDSTLQLIQSGIISFKIPLDATLTSTILPAGKIWICASVNEVSEAVAKIIEVKAQAVRVTFKDEQNDPAFMTQTLGAGKISKLKQLNSAVKKVEQPFSSFGGRIAENDRAYYTRVSERTRHKERAITIWDYEHLVLEAFPSIYKVKCLNHTKYEGSEYAEVAPGHVTVITIPSLENRNDNNPLRPFTNQDVLAAIEAYLKKRISCHVQLHVRHPRFEEVRLELHLKLIEGLAFNYYSDLLKTEIQSFLTPWASDAQKDISFGGRVEKSVLIDFIEERPYVEYVTDVKMYHRPDETSATESNDLDFIEASEGRSILVSAPAAKHVVHEIIEEQITVADQNCIDKDNLIVKPPRPKPPKRPGTVIIENISNIKRKELYKPKPSKFSNPFLKKKNKK